MRARTAAGTIALLAVLTLCIALLWRQEIAAPTPRPDLPDNSPAGAAPKASSPTIAAPQSRELAADATSKSQMVLRGVVRSVEDAQPVRGGAIVVTVADRTPHNTPASSRVGAARDALAEPHRVWSAIGADGSYRIELPGQCFLIDAEIESGDAVRLSHQDQEIRFDAFLRSEQLLGLAVRGPVHDLDLEVSLGQCARGFVVERVSGAPIPNTLVVCQVPWQPFELFGAFTDAQGAFLVSGMAVDPEQPATVLLHASAPGFLERAMKIETTQTGAVMVTLDRGVLLRGNVVDPAGHGRMGADVQIVVTGEGGGPLGTALSTFHSVRSTEGGAFSFTLAPAERAELRAWGAYEDLEGGWKVGRSTRLDVPADRDNTTLVLTLQGHSGFEVVATRPDGSVVDANDLVVMRRTAQGWLCESARFFAEPGVDHELRVLAPGPLGLPVAALCGQTTCMSPGANSPMTQVVVRLQPQSIVSPPPISSERHGERMPVTLLEAPGPHARTTLDLTFVDAASAARLAQRQVTVALKNSRSSAWLSSRGVLRLQLAPGIVDMTLTVDGFLPRTFRLDTDPASYVETEVRMRPDR